MNNDFEEEVNNERALKIVNKNIAELMNEFAFGKNSPEIKEKIEILEQIKEKIYLNDKKIIKMVLEKKGKGVL